MADLPVHMEDLSFAQVILPWDEAVGDLLALASFCEGMALVHPMSDVRKACHASQSRLQEVFLQAIQQRPELYTVAQALLKKEEGARKYYLQEMVQELQGQGCHVSLDKQTSIQNLRKEISDLGLLFQMHIQEDQKSFFVSLEELEGLDDSFIESLSRSSDGLYELTCDYPIYFSVMKHAKKPLIRKQLQELFTSRAEEKNSKVLTQLIEKRHQLAQLLGYKSYAEYDLSQQMAGTPEVVEQFLQDLYKRSLERASLEFRKMTRKLPEGVELTWEGKLWSYDVAYTLEQYSKKHFFLDEREIAEYLPLDHVMEELLRICQTFFDIEMKEVLDVRLWSPDVKVFSIQDRASQTIRGYILADLFPRKNKYTHACECTLLPAYKDYPGITLVVANFPKATSSTPSLLTHAQARTLFHEFGHAIHDLFGRRDLLLQVGTRVKRDFVELPSQLMEEWLWDTATLQRISSHYKTGRPMPSELIQRIVKARSMLMGSEVQRQCLLSKVALACFDEDIAQDPEEKLRVLRLKMQPNYAYPASDHFLYSFGHLDGYGATYYGYLWSKIFVADLFAKMREEGLLQSDVGKRYVTSILQPGGSQDPCQMLRAFLQRDPSIDAFIKLLSE
ncbi:MAG: Zn-dependent oligopeptidase [Chlamydiae bacterium]|nr:Zn-dependent oligopeptidase [Chlamydiota bacterium]